MFTVNRVYFQVREWHAALGKQISEMPDKHPHKKVLRGKWEALTEVLAILDRAIAEEIKDFQMNEGGYEP